MANLFYRGEPFFMIVLTLLLFTLVAMSMIVGIFIFRGKAALFNQARQYLAYLKPIGLFSLMFGLFTQLLGLYGAFTAIKEWGSVSSTILSMGLWTSSIPSLYGLLIFLFSYSLQWGLTAWLNRVTTAP